MNHLEAIEFAETMESDHFIEAAFHRIVEQRDSNEPPLLYSVIVLRPSSFKLESAKFENPQIRNSSAPNGFLYHPLMEELTPAEARKILRAYSQADQVEVKFRNADSDQFTRFRITLKY